MVDDIGAVNERGTSLGIGRICYRSCRQRETDRAAGSRNNRRDHKKERIVGYGARLPRGLTFMSKYRKAFVIWLGIMVPLVIGLTGAAPQGASTCGALEAGWL